MQRFHLTRTAAHGFVFAAFLASIVAPLQAQDEARSCASEPAFALLDFWLGHWDVFIEGQQVGENRIEKILGGCAVIEDWTDARGRRGHSLFYFQPATRTWKQVWVTDQALGRGGLKEKELIAHLPDGSVRFQGSISLKSGESYLDRTTLTPVGPGEVRQVIEISTDDGQSWQATFAGRYVRRQ